MSIEDSVDYIRVAQKYFLCATSLKYFDWDELLKSFDGDYYRSQKNQIMLLEVTVNHPLVVKYPLKWSYQKHFLKVLIDKIERRGGCEVVEYLYEKYMEMLKKVQQDSEQDYHFKHYELPNGKFVTLSERTSIISHGTTGLCSWQGALALSDWLMRESQFLEGKTVLELGSGTGLAGLALLSVGKPLQYCFTDCHPEVLKQLYSNVILNLDKSGKLNKEVDSLADDTYADETFNNSSPFKYWEHEFHGIDIKILNLPWEDVAKEQFEILPDIIVASDVVYDESLFGPLADALEYFLKRLPHIFALLVCTIRNQDTFDKFIKVIRNRGLLISFLLTGESHSIPLATETPIKLIKIKFNCLT